MTRRLLLTLTLSLAAAIAPVATADAAKKKTKPAPYPTVKKVTPLNAGIGDTLRITGKNFVAGKNKNTVVFKRDGKKAIFVKAPTATKTSLTLVVPEKLRSALGVKDGAEQPTKFRIRVLSKRFAKSYTPLKSSPTIAPKGKKLLLQEAAEVAKRDAAAAAAAAAVAATPPPPPDCDGDSIVDSGDPHDDNDGLDDVTEAAIGTDRCKVDTDGDGVEDGWEYKSAFDLNRQSCPDTKYPVPCQPAMPAAYPKKKPYPNPLDGGDAGKDHDGDWLTAWQEHEAWKRHVGAVRDLGIPLWYSDGLQASIDDNHSATCRGTMVPYPLNNAAYGGPEYQIYSLDAHHGYDAFDGCLGDAERDEDNDYLSNVVESARFLSNAQWWNEVYEEPLFHVIFEGLDWLDQDTDGDGIIDGVDDLDHDDFWNIEEQDRGDWSVDEGNTDSGERDGLWVDPFNPCLPAVKSRSCPKLIPVSGDVWRPFWRDSVPMPRWPLYNETFPFADSPFWDGPSVFFEQWNGMPLVNQVMPPVHPLPRPQA